MMSINFTNLEEPQLRCICPDCFNCRNGVENPLPELKVNGPGGHIQAAKPSGCVIS